MPMPAAKTPGNPKDGNDNLLEQQLNGTFI